MEIFSKNILVFIFPDFLFLVNLGTGQEQAKESNRSQAVKNGKRIY